MHNTNTMILIDVTSEKEPKRIDVYFSRYMSFVPNKIRQKIEEKEEKLQ